MNVPQGLTEFKLSTQTVLVHTKPITAHTKSITAPAVVCFVCS